VTRPAIVGLVLFAAGALLTAGGCTEVTVTKPDGTRVFGRSLFQDLAIGELEFERTSSTTRPAHESFRLKGFDQKARLDVINKALDKLP
jgi:hypothetical protein